MSWVEENDKLRAENERLRVDLAAVKREVVVLRHLARESETVVEQVRGQCKFWRGYARYREQADVILGLLPEPMS